jgi:hypothetical protein
MGFSFYGIIRHTEVAKQMKNAFFCLTETLSLRSLSKIFNGFRFFVFCCSNQRKTLQTVTHMFEFILSGTDILYSVSVYVRSPNLKFEVFSEQFIRKKVTSNILRRLLYPQSKRRYQQFRFDSWRTYKNHIFLYTNFSSRRSLGCGLNVNVKQATNQKIVRAVQFSLFCLMYIDAKIHFRS